MTSTNESAMRVVLTRWVERWWAGDAGWRGRLLDLALAPAELLFRGIVRIRGLAYDQGLFHSAAVPVPIISVGNIAVGGTGKTPVTRWLVEEFLRRGLRPAVLHGGYALDEPELHSLWYPDVPVVVGRDRESSARNAMAKGAEVLILDDGFQHRRLERQLDLVLVAAESWGSGLRLLPRGPWRESVRALARADMIAVTRKTAAEERTSTILAELGRSAPQADLVQIHLRPASWSPAPPSSPAIAVTAIAKPELFVENAREVGADIVDTLFFPDHHDYDMDDLEDILARAAGRVIVTTAKDMVKLGSLSRDLDLHVLEQEVVIEEGAVALGSRLDQLVSSSGKSSA